MKEQDFNELLESVKEVGLMERGELAPSREFIIEKNLQNSPSNTKAYAICISNEDEELIPLKIYRVILHPHLQTCTVRDENNETVVCPISWFLPVEFTENIEKTIEKAVLALT